MKAILKILGEGFRTQPSFKKVLPDIISFIANRYEATVHQDNHPHAVLRMGSSEGRWIPLPALMGCSVLNPAKNHDVRMPERIKDYLSLAKPWIVLGNLISAAAGFFLASKGRMDCLTPAATLIGISLVVASGCVFNNCVDRNIDRKMIRTRSRTLVRGAIPLQSAVTYGTILGIAGMALLWLATNLYAVGAVAGGFLIYVFVYSMYMKRNSVYSALVGSLAGAAPPLAGYCAAAGHLDMGAVIVFSIFSLWQIPHCYAIAVFRIEDYIAAGIPVLPAQRGTSTARKHIIGYILAFMAATQLLTLGGYTGYGTFAVVTILSLFWLYLTWWGYKASDERLWAKKVYIFSMVTIVILGIMLSIDSTASSRSVTVLSFAG